MVLSVSTSEDEVFALPSISGVPQHLLVGTQENHVPLNQRPRLQQIDILENYLMRAVMNLQTLERAQVSPLHCFKETAQADRAVLAAELEETIRVSQLKLSGALGVLYVPASSGRIPRVLSRLLAIMRSP